MVSKRLFEKIIWKDYLKRLFEKIIWKDYLKWLSKRLFEIYNCVYLHNNNFRLDVRLRLRLHPQHRRKFHRHPSPQVRCASAWQWCKPRRPARADISSFCWFVYLVWNKDKGANFISCSRKESYGKLYLGYLGNTRKQFKEQNEREKSSLNRFF